MQKSNFSLVRWDDFVFIWCVAVDWWWHGILKAGIFSFLTLVCSSIGWRWEWDRGSCFMPVIAELVYIVLHYSYPLTVQQFRLWLFLWSISISSFLLLRVHFIKRESHSRLLSLTWDGNQSFCTLMHSFAKTTMLQATLTAQFTLGGVLSRLTYGRKGNTGIKKRKETRKMEIKRTD